MNRTVLEWISKAENDYSSARHELDRGRAAHFDLICFLCQQCAEKLIKAAIISCGTVPPKTHNLVELSKLLSRVKPLWTWSLDELNDLSQGAVDYRYPGESADAEDAQWAFAACASLRTALLSLLDYHENNDGPNRNK